MIRNTLLTETTMTLIFRNLLRLIILLLVLILVGLSNVLAAVGQDYNEMGFSSNRTYIKYSEQEYVNPFSGNLILSNTDILLPGNGGLDLRIQRTYNSKIYSEITSNVATVSGLVFGDLGVGWDLHFGRISDLDALPGFVVGISPLFLQMPDGSIHDLFTNNHSNINAYANSNYIAEDFWIVNYDGANDRYIIYLPDGTVYTFGQRVTDSLSYNYYYVTSIEDKNGNRITIEYFHCCNIDLQDPYVGNIGTCPDSNSFSKTRHVKRIVDSVGRVINFGMLNNACRGNAISSIEVNGDVYQYLYYPGQDSASSEPMVAYDGGSARLLKEVIPPEGTGWKYFYDVEPNDGEPDGQLISATYPSGGVAEYDYDTFDLTLRDNTNQTQTFKNRAIVSRTTSGPNITPGTWTYFYNPISMQDSTTVTDPCGNKEEYKFYGLRENSYAGNWSIGLVNEKQIRDSYDNVFQSENNAWIPYQISVDSSIPEEGYFVPLLGSNTITRDGNSYVTNFIYGTFYGVPTRIEEFGELARTIDIAYYENLTNGNYIVGKPLVTTVTVGIDTKTIANSYDSRGNLVSQNRYGVVTDFSYHPDGNLAWEKNSRGIYTHFDQYNYGAAGRIRYGSLNISGDSPVYTEIRAINWEGTVASSTDGKGHQTLFSYDRLNRLIGMTPPPSGEAQTLITYDNTGGRGFTVKKGILEVRYDLDGLGRPIGTFSNAGVLTETRYDQCGRKIYESLPFAFDGSTPNKGENFTFDALGRVISITHPDSTSINYSYSGNTVTIENERNLNKILNFKSFGDPDDKRLVSIRDALNNITSYEYDVFGNVARIDSPQGGDRVFTYNSKNFLLTEVHPENGTTTYTYDEVGNVISKTDAKNQKIQYQYDALNRLTFVDHPLGEDDVIYAYDNANNRTLMESSSGSYSYFYVYDESNRLTRQDVGLGSINFSVNFVYDEKNNLVQATYPSGETVNYNYDVANRVLDIYDAANKLFAGLFTYHPSGAPTSYTTSFGVVSDFTYDSRHRLNTLKVSRTFPFLMIEKDGLGNGTIKSDSPGINCGNDCTEKYLAENIQVTLTVTPDPDSNFVGWSGDPDCLDGILVMDRVKTCIATFALKPVQNTLTVKKAGTGSGIINSSPAGVNCGDDCTENYDFDTQVTLAAIPDSGSEFAGWTGDTDCSDGVVTMDTVKTCTATFMPSTGQQFTLTVNKSGSGFGTVTSNPAGINCGSDCTENYNENTQVTLTATADAGSRSSGWHANSDQDCFDSVVTMDASKTCTAVFIKRATITIEKTGSGSGTVYSYFGTTGNQINCGNVCSSEYDVGDTIVFQETPDPGSQFTGWETCTVLNDYDGFTITGDRTCIAKFDLLPPQHTLTVNKQGDGFGTVTSSPSGINCGSDCTQSYDENTQATLTATPNSGSSFTGWSGDPDCSDGVITIDTDKTCSATFTLSTGQLTLSVNKTGTGTGTVTSSPAGINCGSDCSENYDTNTVVVLTATPDEGSSFAGWSGDADCSDGTVFMDSSKTCTATFGIPQKSTLTVTKSGTGGGHVTSTPAGINCGSDCTEDYNKFTWVTLTAIADAGSSFIGWSGDADCIDGLVTMDTNKTCTATFSITSKREKPTLTVTKSGVDGGTVTSDPSGINCGSDCTEVYNKNTEVTIIVAINPGFRVWVDGTGCFNGYVVLDKSKTCVVNFEKIIPQFALTVNKSGTGAGTVTSSPAGINCGSDCGQGYDRNTLVALTATPNAGSVFSGWSGDPDCIDSVVRMDAYKTCAANFTLSGIHSLTISKTGTGTGTVTSSPAGINCGSDCSENYFDSAQVTLNPIPGPGSSFMGWSGDADCEDGSVTMDTDKNCIANFEQTSQIFNLSVSLSGNGTGVVRSDPSGIYCGSDCAEYYSENTQVMLTPIVQSGSSPVFKGWSGDSDCSDGIVNMNSDKTCIATFEIGCDCNNLNAILGTSGDDNISGTSGDDIICGFDGNDTLIGRGGNDCIAGGSGNDVIKGGGGDDRLYGNYGDDTIQGEGGSLDILEGGAGIDNLDGGSGNNDHCIDGETNKGCEVIQNSSANISPLNRSTFLASKFLIGTDSKQSSKTKLRDLLSSKLTKKNSRFSDILEQTSADRTARSSSLYSRVASYAKSLKVLAVSLLFTTSAYAQTAIPPTPFIDTEYSYDGASNVTAILDHINPQNNHYMQYDSLDRLTGATGPWGPGSFNYDAIGNRITKSIDTTNENYSYGSVDNRLSSYAHDVNGNVLEDHSFTYEYDSENRLVKVLSNGNIIVEYTYDGDGRRISKTAYGEITYYAYGAGLNVLTEFNAQGVPKHDYIYAGNKNIARVNFDGSGVKQNTSFYHTDHLGSSLAMTDESTTVVWGQTYLPFGDAYRGIGNQNNSHQYTGKEFDEDTGLYYYGARYYHAGLGRFMSIDPAPGILTDPQSWNRYSYTLNNPYKYIDPDGEAAVNVQGIINLNTQLRNKLGFVPNFILDILLPSDPESLVTSSLPGPQALGTGVISSSSKGTFEAFARSTFKNERFRKVVLKSGKLLDRAFQEGKNKPIGSFTTRGQTTSKIMSTEKAISILALEGTSNLKPDRIVTLEVLEEIEAFAGFIKNSSEKNAFQIVISPNDVNKLRIIEGSERILK
ncbi:MAG TPA: RHS repeat-associated core domain-containing protein [Thermodesulfobacteriota bacterium]|nr:RHS repeat-associated core domain-containing protein [Thermodesulfobacteriota bacterium]